MNSVSWFIYIAQVSSSLGVMFCILGTLLMVAVMGRFVFPYARNTMEFSKPGDGDYMPPRPIARGYMALSVIFMLAGNLMPEKNTMYAIAASQVGEQIVKTEIASDATKALHSWIKKQIEPVAAKEKN